MFFALWDRQHYAYVTLPFIWTKIGFQMEVEVECASKMLKVV